MNSVSHSSKWRRNGILTLALSCLSPPILFWGDFEISFVLREKTVESH